MLLYDQKINDTAARERCLADTFVVNERSFPVIQNTFKKNEKKIVVLISMTMKMMWIGVDV